MINKTIENILTFSIKKNNRDELVIILHEKEIPNISSWDVIHINLNEEKKLEINTIIYVDGKDEIVNYIFPSNDEIYNLLKRYNLTHVNLYYTSDNENVNLIFNGIIKGFSSLIQ